MQIFGSSLSNRRKQQGPRCPMAHVDGRCPPPTTLPVAILPLDGRPLIALYYLFAVSTAVASAILAPKFRACQDGRRLVAKL